MDPARRWRSTAAWKRASRRQIERQPWCTDCGITTDLTADHIVPVALGGARFDESNLTTRCRRHNSSKGARPLGGDTPGGYAGPAHPRNSFPVCTGSEVSGPRPAGAGDGR